MDRRKKRTSTDQYAMYIDLMERDPIFASGKVPKEVDLNYLNAKWKELAEKLNTCNSGPRLSAEEWRKRLNDWKNTTRCKYRRSLSGEKDHTMTALEMKALNLFGKGPTVTMEPLPHQLKNEKDESENEVEYQTMASSSFPKDLQAVVEEAMCGDDDDIEEEHIESEDFVNDPIATVTVTAPVDGVASGNSTEVPYCTVLADSHVYEHESDDVDYTPPKRKYVEVSSDNISKLSNGESQIKRLRAHPRHLVYHNFEVKQTTSRSMQTNHIPTVIKKDASLPESTHQSLTAQDARDITYQLKRLADLKAEQLRFEIARFKFNNPGFHYTPPSL